MPNGSVKDFFISYNKADRSWAEWISWELEEAKYTVVLQAWDFRPGSNFVLQMQETAALAERTIAVLSPDYLVAKFTQPEWAAAFAQDPTGEKGILLPVRIRECDLKGLLPQIIYIDLVGLNEIAAREALLEGMLRGRAKPTTKPGFPTAPGRAVLKQPRFPNTLPPIWNVPHNRNPNFTGRESLLTDLRTKLTSGQPAALTQAIHGLGGVGKTQTAVEYAYRYATEYDVVWWVRAEETATLAADYACLARELGLPEREATEQSASVKAARRWLGQKTGWLLVFDNAQDRIDIREYLPQATTGHVLITSRNPNWGGTASALHVEVMERTESVNFLLKRTGHTEKEAAHRLAEALGDLPLALEQAGAYIEETGSSISQYSKLFQKHWEPLMQRGTPDPKETVATTWKISFEQVKKTSSAAEDLLSLCAFLAPDDIPLEVIKKHCLLAPPAAAMTLAAAMRNPVTFNDVVAALRRYSLVKGSSNRLLSVHRLVQAVGRERLTQKGTNKTWAEVAVLLLSEAFQFDSDNVQTWPACSSLLPHALVATEHARVLQVAYEAMGRLLSAVGKYSIGRAEFTKVKAAFEQALEIDEALHGPGDPKVATDANNLGFLLKNQGELEDAQAYFERALAINEAAYGPEHPEVAISINNLGIILKDKGDLEGAQTLFERALSINMKQLGREHPEVATNLNNLGYLLKDKGELEGAQAYFERALAINEAAYGPEHPQIATNLNNLGIILKDKGDLEGAQAYFERALAISEVTHGREHPEVATNLNNLGYLLKDKGELEGAQAYFERALAINEAVYGPEHPNVASTVNNLGIILKDKGELEGARAHFERALDILQEFLGEDHPRTMTVRDNLASLNG